MHADYHSKTMQYAIFALLLSDSQLTYIGKSSSPRLSAVYSRHLCGGSAATRDFFSKDHKPDLHLLEIISCTGAEAYKHLLAWIKIFTDAGYICLNYNKSLDQADDPFKDTAAFIHELAKEPLDSILNKSKMTHPTDADKIIRANRVEKSDIPGKTSEPTSQMNVRMRKADKNIFDRFCKENGLNQREGFALLLDQAVETSEHTQKILSDRQQKIADLQKENQKLRTKISILNGEENDPTVTRYRKYIRLLKEGIEAYFTNMNLNEKRTPLRAITARTFLNSPLGTNAYLYPEQEGHAEITLDAVIWSKARGRCFFILGTTADGNRYKFRYYPRWYHVGYHFGYSPCFYSGAKCFVIYTQSPDGAMDIAGAFPVFSVPKTDKPSALTPNTTSTTSLSEKIRIAQSK